MEVGRGERGGERRVMVYREGKGREVVSGERGRERMGRGGGVDGRVSR